MEKRFENFTISVLRLNKLIQKIKLYEMRDYDLKAIHVMCIYYISEHPNGITASELARFTYEDKAAISRALNLMGKKGYVVYDVNKYNAPIHLTEEGKKLATFIADRSNYAVEAGGRTFSEEERLTFYKVIGEICTNLDEYYAGLKK
jgi:DNA-binding MarR family transcriptional regulator